MNKIPLSVDVLLLAEDQARWGCQQEFQWIAYQDRAFSITGWWKERERRGENGDGGRRERKTGQREIREGEGTRS